MKIVATLLLCGGIVLWLAMRPEGNVTAVGVSEPTRQRIETSTLCPWRDPENDLKQFFPGATSHQAERRILSGRRVELAALLGRIPTAEENIVVVERVQQDGNLRGVVLTRRVKGEYGAVELVMAVEPEHRLRAVRIQRSREPDEITASLERGILTELPGKTAADLVSDGSGGKTASAIQAGVRAELILFEMADREGRH